ncbi:MAG: macB [Proteobacteria bacterium]|nr:macB [Pseudomonadota bacterium]
MKPASNTLWQFWLDLLGQALLGLADHKLRTALSATGIAIGIAAVILIATVNRSGKEVIFSELQTFGLKSVWVHRNYKVDDPRRVIRGGTGISNDDINALKASASCPALAKFTPILWPGRYAPLFATRGNRYSSAGVEGVGSAYLEINNDALVVGRGFNPQDIERRRAVAVIGEQVRNDLFAADENPVGKELRIADDKFEIIGVLAYKDRSFLASINSTGGQQDPNGRILIPYNRLQTMLGTEDITMIQGEAVSPGMARAAAEQIVAFLKRRHQDAFKYRIETMQQYVANADVILGIVSTIGLVAATVSLLVAGLGILNIMSTSVIERTREIGLRKAIGGGEGEIMSQFLIEATLISLLGGVFGLLLGAVSSVAITAWTHYPLVPEFSFIVIGFCVSLVVGLISGVYPAYRAAKLRPVEALRYE